MREETAGFRIVVLIGWVVVGSTLSIAGDDDHPLDFVVTQVKSGAAGPIRELISADGQVVLLVRADRRVVLHDADTDEALGPPIELGKGQGFRITALAISPDDRTVATAIGNHSNDWGQVDVWDATSGRHLARYKGPPYLGEVLELRFTHKGERLKIVCGPAGGK